MFQSFLHFVKYNNAFSIIISLVFLSASVSFAAIPDLRDTVLSSEEVVVSVDNNFILDVDIENFDFNLMINDVIEDEQVYHVSYSYKTISLDDSVWKIIDKNENLTVSKRVLERSYLKDLGLYVAKALGDNITAERTYLSKVQNLEREKGLSSKIVAVEYSGLIGQLLNTKQKSFENYSAVIALASPEQVRQKLDPSQISALTRTALLERREKEREEREKLEKEEEERLALMESEGINPEAPVITLIGNNPAMVDVGTQYVDLGATVTDNLNQNLGITVFGDEIDTSLPGTHTVTYVATDQDQNTSTTTREVIVRVPNSVVSPVVETPVAETPAPEVPVVVPEPEVVEPALPVVETPAPEVPVVVPPVEVPVIEPLPEVVESASTEPLPDVSE